jgi:cytochrome bd ubiquinol oxidase subunit II
LNNICAAVAIRVAHCIYPGRIIGKLDIWQSAAATKSLMFTFWGKVVTLPAILAYAFYVYRVFRGKATDLSYE